MQQIFFEIKFLQIAKLKFGNLEKIVYSEINLKNVRPLNIYMNINVSKLLNMSKQN